MEKRNWLKWLKAAGIRALRTFGQTLAATIAVGAAVSEIKWGYILSVAAVAAIASLATSLAGIPEVKSEE